ncbi:DUF6274 family protein [Streptomyces sp. NPDC005953]|uniref:DUF6274 family protein n=1 Tax=Streptomyces sp. NPDC005953 TaxID=3156719 RepID=UPI0033F0BA7C
MAASTARRHETRALLRAHLAAASGYRHLTRHCPICHRLHRLAMEPEGPSDVPPGPVATLPPETTSAPGAAPRADTGPRSVSTTKSGAAVPSEGPPGVADAPVMAQAVVEPAVATSPLAGIDAERVPPQRATDSAAVPPGAPLRS